MNEYIETIRRIEQVKTEILDIDMSTEDLLTAIKGAEYILMLRLKSDRGKKHNE